MTHAGEEIRLREIGLFRGEPRALELGVLILKRLIQQCPLCLDELARRVVSADQQVADDHILGVASSAVTDTTAGNRVTPFLRM